jgi:hypothetical protein
MRLLLNGVQGFNPDEFRLSSVSLLLILRRFQGCLYAQEITVPLFLAHQMLMITLNQNEGFQVTPQMTKASPVAQGTPDVT